MRWCTFVWCFLCSQEDWAEEVKRELVPLILRAHLQGDSNALKSWCGEAVYSKLAADIRMRKQDGIVIDPNILEIDENQVRTNAPITPEPTSFCTSSPGYLAHVGGPVARHSGCVYGAADQLRS